MVKLIIALAELFSSFSAKLHALSEDAPSESIHDVLDIVQDAINEGHLKLPINEEVINADDIRALDAFVTEQIDTHDFDYKFDCRQFEEQTMALIMLYAFENRIDTADFSWHEECREMKEYMFRRYEVWRNNKKEREQRQKERIIKEYQRSINSDNQIVITAHKPDVKI